MNNPFMTPDELEQALRKIGAERYHRNHPFHHAMTDGKLTKGQIQAWALNRYCYQAAIPIKDAYILARMPTIEGRKEWRRRIVDHDGDEKSAGGIERWLKLTTSLGLEREYVISMEGALPITRFSVESYINYVREKPLLLAIASSLTELFSPDIISSRVEGMLKHYDFITQESLAYFTPRLTQAPKDSAFALDYVKKHAITADQQQAVLSALRFKCDVLWSMLDALDYSYSTPSHLPPGAFVPR
ncbi:pyrroloquinoline-quinone synthase PqqC [Entomobacter blattae]|uniref:Pyrroloquinoline-quinone synthase n=1 Tax=Entomobacter blattae TaxID=2762277 RepID=A0A7H1NPR6_9PROT|nr:pyrroloquinoline-quinone synthase PqqC [Entomobacter blattae]QNT77776.1 Bifunctional coenzyme PQQ synthesis protein C/D [Entomobacter blattae]